MVEYVGNAIPAPGYNRKGGFTDPELLQASNPGSYFQKGVTLKSGQGVLPLGTLLKQDPTSKKYIRATDNTAEGILRTTVDTGTDANGQTWMGNILYKGILNLALVSTANSTVALSSITRATINAVQNYFIF